jgi:hypothetical protein
MARSPSLEARLDSAELLRPGAPTMSRAGVTGLARSGSLPHTHVWTLPTFRAHVDGHSILVSMRCHSRLIERTFSRTLGPCRPTDLDNALVVEQDHAAGPVCETAGTAGVSPDALETVALETPRRGRV